MNLKFLTFVIHPSDIYGKDTIRTDLILRVILSYSFLAITGMMLIALFSGWPLTMYLTLIMAALTGFSLILINLGGSRTAGWLALTTFISGVICSAYIGDGLHDLSMVSLPGILLIAAILLDRLLFIIFAVLTTSAPMLITVLKQIERHDTWHPGERWNETLVLILILATIAVGIRILINHILNSFYRVRDSEHRYRNFYANIQDIYFEVDPEGQILEISHRAEELLGYPVREIIGRPIREFYALHLRQRRFVEDVISKKRIENFELPFKDRSEKIKIVSINAALVVDPQGKPQKIVGSIRDISEKKQLEQQLFQAQKLDSIGTLAGGVAHDFNNLLTVINGHCELALSNLGDRDPATAGDILAIKSAGERAANLTRQLLMFSKKQVTSPTVINPNAVIVNMQKMFNRLLGEDITIDYQLDETVTSVLSDPIQFEQVLLNLMINARDALKDHPDQTLEKHIRVTTRCLAGDNMVEISIRDNGIGMESAVRERVFEPFFTTKENGTGLGLSTVYGIIKQNNATISVESEPGSGSTFIVLWPLNLSRADRENDLNMDKDLSGTENILLVEDDPAVCQFTAQALRQHGYTVTEAPDSATALEYFIKASRPVDLLVTDMILPGMNGLDLYHTLKEKNKDLRVLFISGYANMEILNKLQPQERQNFLHKPFGITDLLQNVRRVIGKTSNKATK